MVVLQDTGTPARRGLYAGIFFLALCFSCRDATAKFQNVLSPPASWTVSLVPATVVIHDAWVVLVSHMHMLCLVPLTCFPPGMKLSLRTGAAHSAAPWLSGRARGLPASRALACVRHGLSRQAAKTEGHPGPVLAHVHTFSGVGGPLPAEGVGLASGTLLCPALHSRSWKAASPGALGPHPAKWT